MSIKPPENRFTYECICGNYCKHGITNVVVPSNYMMSGIQYSLPMITYQPIITYQYPIQLINQTQILPPKLPNIIIQNNYNKNKNEYSYIKPTSVIMDTTDKYVGNIKQEIILNGDNNIMNRAVNIRLDNTRKNNINIIKQKNIKCKYCGKGFQLKHELRVHLRHQSCQRPYKCDICNKTFTTNSNRKAHVLIHSGIQPYKCEWPNCNKKFNRKGTVMHAFPTDIIQTNVFDLHYIQINIQCSLYSIDITMTA